MKHTSPSRETPRSDNTLVVLEAQVSTDAIRRTSWMVAVMPLILLAINYGVFNNANMYGASVLYPSILLSMIGLTGVVLSYWVNSRALTTGVIFAVQAAATYGLFSFGSIRGAGSVVFLATVVAAGIFLGRGTLLAALLSSFIALGAVTYAEAVGDLTPITLQVGIMTWFTHAAVLLAVALVVLYARERTRNAYQERIHALEENRRLALERDRSLEQFTRIFRTSPSPMVAQVAATGKILDVNPAFERCYGYRKSDVIGKSDYMLWALPEQREKYLFSLKEDHRAEQLDATGLRADGSRFDAHIRSEKGSEREDNLVITTVTDMTEQNNTLRRLRRSEERFSKAFHFSPLKLIITRLSDDTVIEMGQANDRNPASATVDFQGRPAQEAVPWFSAYDRATFVQRLLQEGHLSGYPSMLTRPDGSTIDAKVWAEQIDIDGEPCILSCTVDTTDEQRRDALLRDIAKGMTGHTAQAFFQSLTQRMASALAADMVFVGEITADQEVNTLSVFKNGQSTANHRFPLMGTTCEQSLLRKALTIHGSGRSADFGLPALLEGAGIEASVCQVLHSDDGQVIGVLSAMWAHPITENDELRSLMAIFSSRAHAELMRLRSERKIEHFNNTLEQRVLERTAELSKLNAELDSFAYSISHDLKSPLRAIDGFTQILKERLDGRLDTEEHELMDRILGATHHMATLMADLLALARVSQVPLHQERINLSLLAEDELQHCLEKTPRPQLRWHIELGLIAYADTSLTRVVLKNLIENAIKYTRDQAAPLIEIGQVVTEREDPDQAVEFFVRDNGAGFSMDHASKLFKPFQSLHMPSAGFEGTGIGLATVRRVVERHGGAIQGEAQQGQGAVFRFTLGKPPKPQDPRPTPPQPATVAIT